MQKIAVEEDAARNPRKLLKRLVAGRRELSTMTVAQPSLVRKNLEFQEG